MKYQKPRGTVDLIGYDAEAFSALETYLKKVANLYDYREIKTPIFESKDLFYKAVGATSDIVNKEIYEFKDKGDRELALRPEGTAGTIRAIVENKLLSKETLPVKYFYTGPMFRYERPQNGRQRQFHQFGVECVGSENFFEDIEVIMLAYEMLNALKITKFELKINNIGSFESRKNWSVALKKYFAPFKDQLSEDSQKRLVTNPLRILDDKVDGIKQFVKDAPKLSEFLNRQEKAVFLTLMTNLQMYGIPYKHEETLVRGLDYYTGVVFEFVSTCDDLTGQSTLIAGGRYADLVKMTGGPDVQGVGFGLGMERLLIALKSEKIDILPPDAIDVVLAPLSLKAESTAMGILWILRLGGFSGCINHNVHDLNKHFRFAKKKNANFVIIIGDKDLAKKVIQIKNEKTNSQIEVAANADEILKFFRSQNKVNKVGS